MAFTKKNIPSKILCIIDIGSYKLRVCAASFKNKEIKILGYTEKRQDISFFSNGECRNLPALCENIAESIAKLEESCDIKLDQIVINYPFGELFLSSKKINYKRKLPHNTLQKEELETIMQSVEKLCLKHLASEVDRLYGLSPQDIQIILSRVNSVTIDGMKQKKVIGKTGEHLRFSLLNAFIPRSKHNLLAQIGNVVGKKIYKILPTEYCITKIFQEKNIVIINIGATQTSISLKVDDEVVAISKIGIGINDLVNKISQHHDETRAAIISKLNNDEYFQLEKANFLNIWGESFGITLKEMLGDIICPKYFFVGGGGGNNVFIAEYLQNFSYAKHDIRMLNTIEFVQEDMSLVLDCMKSISIEDIKKIPLDMFVLLRESNHLISREHDTLSISLKTAIKNLGYISS
ncbi:hypothetical protein GW846_01435 [Candidatus Gracilibacteria bacterium]|nr:hypothetical protein [Candidatus Gracilibacteria bacterium]